MPAPAAWRMKVWPRPTPITPTRIRSPCGPPKIRVSSVCPALRLLPGRRVLGRGVPDLRRVARLRVLPLGVLRDVGGELILDLPELDLAAGLQPLVGELV